MGTDAITTLFATAQWPEVGATIDPVEVIAGEVRLPHPDRPWVMTNMIASLDGGTAVDGLSGPLGGPADLKVFIALRAVADLIIVGAATATAESYKPPRPAADIQAARTARGQAPRPTVVVVSRSLSLEPTEPLFADPDHRPVILTVEDAPRDRVTRLSEVADLVIAGSGNVDLPLGLKALRSRGEVALLEGGPSLNGQFVAAGLIDEWNQTIAPVLVSGPSARPAAGPPPPTPTQLELTRLLTGDGLLFGRWVRTDLDSVPG